MTKYRARITIRDEIVIEATDENDALLQAMNKFKESDWNKLKDTNIEIDEISELEEKMSSFMEEGDRERDNIEKRDKYRSIYRKSDKKSGEH